MNDVPSSAELDALRLSLEVAVRSVGFSLPLAVLVAWILTRARFPGRMLFDAFVHLPLVLPPVGLQLEPPPLPPVELPQAASTSALPAATIAIFHTFTLASLKAELPRPECTGDGCATAMRSARAGRESGAYPSGAAR